MPRSKILKDGEYINYGGSYYYRWQFKNPMGAAVKCTATSGKGEVTIYKNDRKIGAPYIVSSTDPEYPTAVYLNTGSWGERRKSGTYTLAEASTPLAVARLFGIPVESLLTANGLTNRNRKFLAGTKLTIPDSEWELWIQQLGHEKAKFRVELLPEEP